MAAAENATQRLSAVTKLFSSATGSRKYHTPEKKHCNVSGSCEAMELRECKRLLINFDHKAKLKGTEQKPFPNSVCFNEKGGC